VARGLRLVPLVLNCHSCNKSFEMKGTASNAKYCEDCREGFTYYKRRLSKLFSAAKNRAAAKNLAFNISPEYLFKLWEDSDGCCAVTGRPLVLFSYGDKYQANPNAPSLDRIKPSLGYIQGNVRLICYHLNIALSDFGEEEFERLCKDFLYGATA